MTLRTARLAAGYSQTELAYLVRVHPTHIADIEHDRKRPSALLAEKLRTALEPHLDGVEIPTRSVGRPRNAQPIP